MISPGQTRPRTDRERERDLPRAVRGWGSWGTTFYLTSCRTRVTGDWATGLLNLPLRIRRLSLGLTDYFVRSYQCHRLLFQTQDKTGSTALARGLALSSRSELQQVLERRKRVQSDRDEEGQSRTPLEDVLLRRQQKQIEREKEQGEEVRGESQLMEFVRVRQNLRKIHSVIQDKAANT